MKAPTELDRYLRQRGFGYGKPYYQRLHRELPLVQCIFFGREKPGLHVHFAVTYFDKEGGPQLSPPEIECLLTNGQFSGVPSTFDKEGFWPASSAGELIAAIEDRGERHLEHISDCELMLSVLEFLMDQSEDDAVSQVFPELAQPWVSRMVTPARLLSKAGYLNVAGKFEAALETLKEVNLRSRFEHKMRHDAEARAIVVPVEAREYLKRIS